jgi:hypothetical protein
MTSAERTDDDGLHIGGTWLPSASASASATTRPGPEGSSAASETSRRAAGRDRP